MSMIVRILGVVLVLVGCGGFGFSMAAADLRKTNRIKKMITAIEHISRELEYRNLPLPDLCQSAASVSGGIVGSIFSNIAGELTAMLSPDVKGCVQNVLHNMPQIPNYLRSTLELLGNSMGKFDREGQLKGLASAVSELGSELKNHAQGQEARLRCYQTLGLCAGAAIAILMI